MVRAENCTRLILLTVLITILTGCGDDEEDEGSASTGNHAPVISGVSPPMGRIDEPYSFRPNASDADGDRLTFSASNLPAWAGLDSSTGELYGMPFPGQEGSYAGIRISVSDGKATSTLGPFTIIVNQEANGSATVSWLPPLENADGSVLRDLQGYRIQYGRDRANLSQSILITNPSLSAVVVERLSQGTWYFSVVAINSRGIESVSSSIASKVIG